MGSLRKISKQELEEILREHHLWFNCSTEDGEVADLSYVDFSGMDLSDLNMRDINLTGSNFTKVNLTNTDLGWSTLDKANFTDTILHSTRAFNTCVKMFTGLPVDIYYSIDTKPAFLSIDGGFINIDQWENVRDNIEELEEELEWVELTEQEFSDIVKFIKEYVIK